jgi:trehalose-phosphatase
MEQKTIDGCKIDGIRKWETVRKSVDGLAFEAVIFDLDGVITNTASVHALAWKETFDTYLHMRENRDGEMFREFTHENDYLPFVDGKPRYQGVKSFLKSRGIELPFGKSQDPPDKETICGIGNRKNEMFREVLTRKGAEVFESTVELIRALRKRGVCAGVASSSKNCQQVLKITGLEELFQTRVDGVVSAQLGLKGKPEGDIFISAAHNLGVTVAKSVVVEDATSGVQAGRNGGFGLVLGIARENNSDELFENGADIVVNDLSEIGIEQIDQWFTKEPRPLFASWESISSQPFDSILEEHGSYTRNAEESIFQNKPIAVFLDYDGTLTPIVSRPHLAKMSDNMRAVVRELSGKHTVSIVSGRPRAELEALVAIKGIHYAGSHGMDISGPGATMMHPQAQELIPLIDQLAARAANDLSDMDGIMIEEKKFSLAIHYRLMDVDRYFTHLQAYVQDIVTKNKGMRLMHGKKVFEILPDINWNKGNAVNWMMRALKKKWNDTSVLYIGDDTTDEDAFRVVRTRGTGVLVADTSVPSAAAFRIPSPDEVYNLLKKISER